ncbi:hypothetical protein J437_LFUL011917 [Ladona fulva]|uniref:G-protein coupled receptors family 1 profile domain-containing protein n=1 Tax=Ladona fulva TaxID=123851 RepID=A0A8K0JUH7_LADFU|nr:hypothetical protein J437_LFUL011917 [Ladona fulva]
MNEGRRGKGTMLRLLGATQRREVKATQNLAILVLLFVVCWIPLYTINCVKAFCPDCPVEGALTLFCVVLSHFNSAVNPILYAYHLKDYRAALRGIFHCNRNRGSQNKEIPHIRKPEPPSSQNVTDQAESKTNVSQKFLKILPQETMTFSSTVSSSSRDLAEYPEVLSPEALMSALEMTVTNSANDNSIPGGGADEVRDSE